MYAYAKFLHLEMTVINLNNNSTDKKLRNVNIIHISFIHSSKVISAGVITVRNTGQ